MKVGLTIKGDKKLRANLTRLTKVRKAQIDPLMQAALEPMKDLTASNAMAHRQPFNPIGGHLDEGVVSVPIKVLAKSRVTWWVSFTGRARKIAHLLEFGTAPHDQPRRGIRHPGARPFPFFRPAFETTKEGAIARLAAGVRNLLISRISR
jgi:hypothetical protein